MRVIPALLLTLALTLSLTFFPSSILASHSRTPAVAATLAKNRLSVNASFLNLRNVAQVKYQLTYDSNKGPQGAGGTIRVGRRNKSLWRRLLLGTCSGRVCTYHSGVRNIKLSVDFTLRSGGIISYEKKL